MSPQEIASWVFGSILLTFVLVIFIIDRYVFSRGPIEPHLHNLLGVISAILAGLFAYFFTGTIGVTLTGSATQAEKLALQATGGAGAFIIILWWWKSGLSPVKSKTKSIKITEHSVPPRIPKTTRKPDPSEDGK